MDSLPPYTVIEDNEHFLLVNKAPGLICQGADASHNLLNQLKKDFALSQLFPVHRLDAGTSGLLVFAKSTDVNQQLSKQFQDRKVNKLYLALSDKKPKKKQGEIRGDMEKARAGSWRLSKNQNNPAVTWFFSFGLGGGRRLFVLKPLTGKTHQLRVALKAMAAPILGDDRYGGTDADRLYLHAFELGFVVGEQEYVYREWPNTGELFVHPDFVDKVKSLNNFNGIPWPKKLDRAKA